jgi:hypothetical protein
MYCGNNSRNPELINGVKQLGDRYSCFKTGIGKGLQLPYDPSYSGEYVPIDNFKIYCGIQNTLPGGYDKLGNLPECLQKGIGIGKTIKARRDVRLRFGDRDHSSKIFVYIATIAIPFIIFSVKTPKFFKNKDDTLNRRKFASYFILYSLILGIIFYIIK